MISDKPKIKTLSQLAGETLYISQPTIWKFYFDLKYNDEILGKINRKGVFRPVFNISLFDKKWEIYYPDFWPFHIAIREQGKENPVAFYKRKFFNRSGDVFLPKGKKLKMKREAFKGDFRIYNLSGKCLITLRALVSLKSKTEIKIEENSELLDEYPWVIFLAWRLLRQRKGSG